MDLSSYTTMQKPICISQLLKVYLHPLCTHARAKDEKEGTKGLRRSNTSANLEQAEEAWLRTQMKVKQHSQSAGKGSYANIASGTFASGS